RPISRRRGPLQPARGGVPRGCRTDRDPAVLGNYRTGAARQEETDRRCRQSSQAPISYRGRCGDQRSGAEPSVHRNTTEASGGLIMRIQNKYLLASILAAALILGYRTFLTVQETEFVLVTQFGRPLYIIDKAGLHFKWAFQSASYFDRRLRIYNPRP